jgi:Erythromycin biosynthesis protein CIII-like, C-terminal domain
MQILFSSMPYLGHFYPLVPLAQSLGERHEVQVASAPSFGPEIIRANLRPVSAGIDGAEALHLLWAQFPDEPLEALERQRRVLSTDIAVPRMVEDLRRLVRESRPDLLIYEEGELAAPIVSRGAGTTIAALSHGLPLMILPQGADSQSRLAAACEAAGAAIVPQGGDPEGIRRALHALIRGGRHRRAAQHIAAEMTTLPAWSGVAERLESMAA